MDVKRNPIQIFKGRAIAVLTEALSRTFNKCYDTLMKKILSEILHRFMQKYSQIYGIPNNQTCYSISTLRVFVLGHLKIVRDETHSTE